MTRSTVETRDLSSRLKFLEESARLLLFGAPETSSFLEAQQDQLLRQNGIKIPESRRRQVCGACGTILIPGHSCKLLHERKQSSPAQMNGAKRRKSESKVIPKATKYGSREEKVYVCSSCYSETRVTLPATKASTHKVKEILESAPSPPMRPTSAESGNVSTMGLSVAEKPQSGVANVSSKKRAKARKGGLQAMLANSKKENKPASSEFGLDLMDLMRSA